MKLPALFDFRGSPEFTTDGCSGYMTWAWNVVFRKDPPWNRYCIEHDRMYWSGGREGMYRTITRWEADMFLFNMVGTRSFVWAVLCWLGCRIGGSQYLPFSWRWRYRERWLDVITGGRL